MILEANALGTAFLRMDYLPEPARSELRHAIFAYAQTRLLPEGTGLVSQEAARAFIDRSLAAQANLRPLTVEATADPLPTPLATFVASSVNDVLDAHQVRMRSVTMPVVELTQNIVIVTALAALFLLGNRMGLAGRSLTWRTFLFCSLLFAVMMTIIDVQRVAQGLIRVDQSALKATLIDMERALR